MNQNNGHRNHTVALKATNDAVKEANKWQACVPFMLSDDHNELNFTSTDMFSMVHLHRHLKEFYFHPKHKPSDKLGWKVLLKDLQREGYKHGTRLVSLGSQNDRNKRITSCFRHTVLPSSAHTIQNGSLPLW